MDRSMEAGGTPRPGPWRHGFEIPISLADVVPDLPDVLTWVAGGATVGFIAVGALGVPLGAAFGVLGHAIRHR